MSKTILFKKLIKSDHIYLDFSCLINFIFKYDNIIQVVIKKNSYLIEKHSILLLNNYLVLKQISIIYAFFIIKKIFRHEKMKNYFFWVNFNLKKVFNDITIDIIFYYS